jgi:hypothetical protein
VGFRVGGKTNLHYLVLEVHYREPMEPGQFDSNSGYMFQITNQTLPYQAGIFLIGTTGYIPPQQKGKNYNE